jgi:hypothetical protein
MGNLEVSFGKVVENGMDTFILGGKEEGKEESRAKGKVATKASKSNFTFPTHQFAAMGANVLQRGVSEFSIDFGNKHFSAVSSQYIKKVLSEAWKNNELVSISEEPLWDITKVGSNKFIVKRA